MDVRDPRHPIFRDLDPDELLRRAAATPTDRRRRSVPLTEEEDRALESASPEERQRWLDELPTSEYLARVLESYGLRGLAERARANEFHDFLSQHATPEIELYHALAGSEELRTRLCAGEFDATSAESDAWAESEDGKAALASLPPELREKLSRPASRPAALRHRRGRRRGRLARSAR